MPGTTAHTWEPGSPYCSCGSDTVTCQVAGELTCGTLATWMPVPGRSYEGNVCPAHNHTPRTTRTVPNTADADAPANYHLQAVIASALLSLARELAEDIAGDISLEEALLTVTKQVAVAGLPAGGAGMVSRTEWAEWQITLLERSASRPEVPAR